MRACGSLIDHAIQERIRGGGGKECVTRASTKPGEIWRECYFWKSSTHLTSTTTGNHRTASIFSTAQGFRLHYRPYALLPEVTRSSPPPPPPPTSYALLDYNIASFPGPIKRLLMTLQADRMCNYYVTT